MSRLYPGWGSGSKIKTFNTTLRVKRNKKLEDIDFGDKIILPQSILKEAMKLRLDLPLLVNIKKVRALKTQTNLKKGKIFVCGVQEFSAQEGSCFLPKALLNLLETKETKEKVYISVWNLTSIERDNIPKAISVRLKPHKGEFLTTLLNNNINIVNFMETALKRYTVLNINQNILVQFKNIRYDIKIDVLEPMKLVSLLGDIDVLIDFSSPLDSNEVGRIRPKQKTNLITNNINDKTKETRTFQHNKIDIKSYKKFQGKGLSLENDNEIEIENENENKENCKKNICTSILSREEMRQKRLNFLDNLIHQVM